MLLLLSQSVNRRLVATTQPGPIYLLLHIFPTKKEAQDLDLHSLTLKVKMQN